jgi:hypothetical protein
MATKSKTKTKPSIRMLERLTTLPFLKEGKKTTVSENEKTERKRSQ